MITAVGGVVAALAMSALVIGIVGLVRGHVTRLMIDSRPVAGLVTAASFTVAVATFGALAPDGSRGDTTVAARPLEANSGPDFGHRAKRQVGDLATGLPRAEARQFPETYGAGSSRLGTVGRPPAPPASGRQEDGSPPGSGNGGGQRAPGDLPTPSGSPEPRGGDHSSTPSSSPATATATATATPGYPAEAPAPGGGTTGGGTTGGGARGGGAAVGGGPSTGPAGVPGNPQGPAPRADDRSAAGTSGSAGSPVEGSLANGPRAGGAAAPTTPASAGEQGCEGEQAGVLDFELPEVSVWGAPAESARQCG